MSSNSPLNFINPATQTPVFVAEWLTCAYPVSDIWSASPRYLYYILLVLVFATQWHSWLANVFLGVVATYGGTAAIEAFVLMSHAKQEIVRGNVTIPYIDPQQAISNATLARIPNLVTGKSHILVAPSALDFDIDAVTAITVTGYLMMLPMHCWSSAVRESRARHLLILIWNALMFAGMICSIILWPTLYDDPLQYRFCYPTILDSNSITSDGLYSQQPGWYDGTWNDTVWDIFKDYTRGLALSNNCFYPCFNNTQILRRTNNIMADLTAVRSSRLSVQLSGAGIDPITNIYKETNLAYLMIVALVVTTAVMCLLLIIVITPLRNFTRVPVSRPKELLQRDRKELFHVLWKDFTYGMKVLLSAFRRPSQAMHRRRSLTARSKREITIRILQFYLDILCVLLLFVAMFLTPATVVVFIIFIEWYIHRDLVSGEAPAQVGQWTTSVSVALILISALFLRAKYRLATRNEIQNEIFHTKEHLEMLEGLLQKCDAKKRDIEIKRFLQQRQPKDHDTEMSALGTR